ncbi:uncharacterized protein TM35_000202270 [Trypanosoma theileri]|uniref:Uncharacterized protein n=1 Tax=Trypanosoma theileri TaxID=67003 RepID=A0A1X0NTF4_9TRYP|nr:uncharacterized protein TM35_000202270 [Trypanosoma theileri]ORC87818.1 hypothetical protein TM35_000202270 [Trypanosoma theileri]
MGQASSFALKSVERACRRHVEHKDQGNCHPDQESDIKEIEPFSSPQSLVSMDSFLFTINDLREMTSFLPESLSNVDLHHLPLLFVLDNDKDGLFSYDDLQQFIAWSMEAVPKEISIDDLMDVLRGRAVLRCWYVCCMESQKGGDGIKEGIVLGKDENVDTLESREYFTHWVLKLLHTIDNDTFSLKSIIPSLPLLPKPNESNTMATNELFGVPGENSSVAHIGGNETREEQSTLKVNCKKGYWCNVYDEQPQISLESTGGNVLLSTPCEDYSLFLKEEKRKWNEEDSEKYSSEKGFGIEALKELYEDLMVSELYGLSFWGFCQILNPYSAEKVEKAASLERKDATILWMSAEAAVSDQLQLIRNMSAESEPVTSFFATVESVEGFLMCFCNAYWNTLKCFGLNPSNGGSVV